MDNGSNPLDKLVKKIIEGLGDKGKLGKEEIMDAWEAAVGTAAVTHARPVSFKKNTLIVNVDGSSWLYELTTRKIDIIKKLESGLGGKKVKEIRFRIGDIAGK